MADPIFAEPYGQKNFMGNHVDDAAATTWVQDQQWDTNKDGTGDPEINMWYWNLSLDSPLRFWNGTEWADPGGGGGGIQPWYMHDEDITRVSSTVFTVTDTPEAQEVFKPGRPLQAMLSGGAGSSHLIVTDYTGGSIGTVTVAGGLSELITGEVLYGDFTRVIQMEFSVKGSLPGAETDTVVEDENKAAFRWQLGKARMVRCMGYLYSADSGSAAAVSPMIEGNECLSTDLSIGSSQTWEASTDEINAGQNVIEQDQDIDIKWVPGSGADADDLTVSMAFIVE